MPGAIGHHYYYIYVLNMFLAKKTERYPMHHGLCIILILVFNDHIYMCVYWVCVILILVCNGHIFPIAQQYQILVYQLLHYSSSSNDVITLTGHSGPVYSTSFNPDKSLLLSSSEDGTGTSPFLPCDSYMLCIVRLWSLLTHGSLLCFRGHNYPIWSVEFR